MRGRMSKESLVSLLSTALSQKLQQKPAQYQTFLQHLRFGADSTLRRVLGALGQCVGLLGKSSASFDELISTALALRFRAVPLCDLERVSEVQASVAKQAMGKGGAAGSTKLAAMCTLETSEAQVAFAVALVASNMHLLLLVVRALVKGLAAAKEESDAYCSAREGLSTAAPASAGEEGGAAPLPPGERLPRAIAAEASTLLSSYFRTVYAGINRI